MATLPQCPNCGCEMAFDFPSGLCPDCLFTAGLNGEDDVGGSGDSSPFAATTPQPGGFVPPLPALLAKHFPQLEIVTLLGQGGMGAVYTARQKKLDRLVALKIIRPESANDAAFAERFNREARTLARLSHPHIVAVHDFGEVSLSQSDLGDETPRALYYFVMEYVDGANLRQLIAGGNLSPAQSMAIIPQICDALQFAHDAGIVHRDIKPENILLDRGGRVKIADFGLAKLASGSDQNFTLTGTHQVMGTPLYMAPEQMTGSHAVDHRADIYSLGVVFYEMLTGHLPMGQFDPPSQQLEIDARLDDVVLRALAREPQRRYQHASEISNDVNIIRGIYSSEALQSIQELGGLWPGASTIFEGALGKIAGGVRGSALRRFFTAPAVPGIVSGVLSVFGALSIFIEWGYVEDPIRGWQHVYGYDELAGILIGILFFAYAAVMFISTTSGRRPAWRPWSNFLTAAGIWFLAFIYAGDAFRGATNHAAEVFFFPIALGIALSVVGAWDLRCWLHQPHGAGRWNTLPQAINAVGGSPQATATGGLPRKTGRDWVTLTREQVENDLLPDICMVCGTPTEGRVNKTFSFVKVFRTKEMRVACPICPRHRGHWRNLVLTASTGWLLMFLFAGIGMLMGMVIAPRHGGPWAAGSAMGFFFGLAVYVGSIIYLACTRVTVESITDHTIKFRRVSAAFANSIAPSSPGNSAAEPQQLRRADPPAAQASSSLSEQHRSRPVPSLDERRVEMHVKAPTIGLFVTAIAGVAFWLVVGTNLLNDSIRRSQFRNDKFDVEIAWYFISGLAVLAVAAVMIIGAVKMRRLRGYEWCMAAAILALIPWTGMAYPLGVIIGAWSLKILLRADVKDAFLARSLHDD